MSPSRDDTVLDGTVLDEPATAGSTAITPQGTGRRRFLTYLVAAPVLTIAAKLGLEGNSPAVAAISTIVPQPGDILDLGDALILAGLPTAGLLQLTVLPSGQVELELPRAEVGQGITTAFAMLVADEMDIALNAVKVTLADARVELFLNQLTGASNSVRSLYHPVRQAAASARGRLLTAAAQQWGTSRDTLSVRDGTVYGPGGQSALIGTLTVAAAQLGLPNLSAKPKDPSEYKLVGTPTNRIDARKAVTGQLEYSVDFHVPGAMPTMIARPPTTNGKPISFNETQIRSMPGVLDVALISTGVAIRAETFGQARDAKQAVRATWTKGTVDDLSDADIFRKIHAATLPFAVPPLLSKKLDAEFDFHSNSNAALEPNAAIADVRTDRAEIWSALKSPVVAKQRIAELLHLPVDKVTVHVLQSGGSFGRRLFFDAALEAAEASQKFGKPVRVMWTRIDDMRHGRARPAMHHKLRATFALGQVLSYEQRVACVETDFRHGIGEILTSIASDLPIVGPASFSQIDFLLSQHVPYKFGVVTELLNEVPLKMHTGSWRSVYSATTKGSQEMFVDEIAAHLGKDPVAFRLASLEHKYQVDTLNKVATEGQWGRSMPTGFGQGVGFHDEFKSCTACLVEVDARNPKKPRVTKAVIAVDVGLCLNPRGLESQMLGGLTDAIGLVLRAGLHFEKGLPLEGSYSQFHFPRQADSPPDVQIFVMDSKRDPGGAGELGVPAPVGAIANAFTRATGVRPRMFPINFPVDFTPFPAE